jgi:uncharacterized small protein (DUF1192 family)
MMDIENPVSLLQKTVSKLIERIKVLESEVDRLTKLVQEHQTYQTKQGDKS